MNTKQTVPVLEVAKAKLEQIVDQQGWRDIGVSVAVKMLTPEKR
jgi:hypothetical protein